MLDVSILTHPIPVHSFSFHYLDARLLLPILLYGNTSGRLNSLSFLVKCYVRVVFR